MICSTRSRIEMPRGALCTSLALPINSVISPLISPRSSRTCATSPGVRDYCDSQAFFELTNQLCRAGGLVMLVIADGPGHDAVMIQKLLSLASVFTCDEVSLLQDTDCTQSHVFEIADGRGHEIESR